MIGQRRLALSSLTYGDDGDTSLATVLLRCTRGGWSISPRYIELFDRIELFTCKSWLEAMR